jgi:hypothetical protein
MNEIIPLYIDGAKTLFYTILDNKHLKTGKTKHIVDGNQVESIYGLSICKYENDPGFYLFYCDENWDVITDTYHESVEEAKEQAEFEYINSIATWTEVKDN